MNIIGPLRVVRIRIDASDAELVRAYHWTPTVKILVDGSSYIQISTTIDHKSIYLGRLLIGARSGYDVDHIDGDTTNFHRKNLREITHAQNNMNRSKGLGTSIYKGVSWNNEKQKWVVHINRNHIGYFTEEVEAADAYNKAAIEVFGEFARLNEI